ncbi:MAG: heparinase II/III family protein, partial [Armatimonadetes bacterium]|nr:heparinase II/III family protein [Armatimonadota bacterium]
SQVRTENLFAFLKYGDPRFARALTNMKGELATGELWEPYPEEELRAALDDPRSQIVRNSRLLDGYGVAILEAGEYPDSRALVLNYSSTIGHRQMDQLSIGLYARGVELLEDLGYPRTWNYRYQWDSHNMAHNTVTINESRFTYPRFFGNAASLFASENGVHVITAHHNPYESLGCDLYERTDIMVEVDEKRFYVVDLFAVDGGEQHDQSWLGMYVEPEAPALDWTVQETGTLAGPDVEEFAAYTDRWGHEHPQGDFPSYLTEIRRAPLEQPATWTWRSGLEEGDGLALHVIPVDGPVEAVMGKGRSPVWQEDKITYLLVRRQVQPGQATHYLTVLDPFQGEPEILGVRLKSTDPIVLEVERTDGTDEITLQIPEGPSLTTAPRPIGVRVIVRGGDEVRKDVRVGALGWDDLPGYAEGEVASLDYDTREVTIAGDDLRLEDFAPGRTIRIYNDMRSAMYRIEAAEMDDGRVVVTLDKPALLGRFPVVDVQDGRLELGVKAPFMTGHTNGETGELTDGINDYYYGAWVGEGATARQVQGISNTSPPLLYLVRRTDDEVLQRDYAGEVIPVWYYGVGDRIEVARIRQ